MSSYELKAISAFGNNKRQKEFDKYIGQKFQMNDKISYGNNVILKFADGEIKGKLENVECANGEVTLVTNNFVLVCKPNEDK